MKIINPPIEPTYIREQNNNLIVRCKLFEIGDWDMTAAPFKTVTVAGCPTNIVSITGVVRSDSGENYIFIAGMLEHSVPWETDYYNVGFYEIRPSMDFITLWCNNGLLAWVNYSSLLVNRGHILIWYL